jgi:hypothetical protein
MPFAPEFRDVYELGVKAAAASLNILAERVDDQVFHEESMLHRIYAEIDRADIIIADMTGRNANVFYEVGYAHAKGKLCILLTKTAADIPFDLKHHRHIIYGTSISTLKEKLASDLSQVKMQLANRGASIDVSMVAPNTSLLISSFWAEGRTTLTFDFHNRTDRPSPEIDAIYFYTNAGWSYSNGGDTCASIKSDVPGFELRHFIPSPIRRLDGKNGWAQIKLNGAKILESVVAKGKLREKYQSEERVMIRVIAAARPLDFEFSTILEFQDELNKGRPF